jgi:hypothetical protein
MNMMHIIKKLSIVEIVGGAMILGLSFSFAYFPRSPSLTLVMVYNVFGWLVFALTLMALPLVLVIVGIQAWRRRVQVHAFLRTVKITITFMLAYGILVTSNNWMFQRLHHVGGQLTDMLETYHVANGTYPQSLDELFLTHGDVSRLVWPYTNPEAFYYSYQTPEYGYALSIACLDGESCDWNPLTRAWHCSD